MRAAITFGLGRSAITQYGSGYLACWIVGQQEDYRQRYFTLHMDRAGELRITLLLAQECSELQVRNRRYSLSSALLPIRECRQPVQTFHTSLTTLSSGTVFI